MLDYILSNNSFEILVIDIRNSKTFLKQSNIAFAIYLYFQMISNDLTFTCIHENN